jgi:hypothetical protein
MREVHDMELAFGEHYIRVRRWTEKRQMLENLKGHRFAYGHILLGADIRGGKEFWSLAVGNSLGEGARFGIGMVSQHSAIEPGLLLLPAKEMLFVGCNREVAVVNVVTAGVVAGAELEGGFRHFLHLRERSTVLVLHETGVLALDESGAERWRFDRDVIIAKNIRDGQLHLLFQDEPPVTLSLDDGRDLAPPPEDFAEAVLAELPGVIALAESLIAGEITAADFAHRCNDLRSSRETLLPDDVHWLLAELAGAVEDFEPDPKLREGSDYLDERQLIEATKKELPRMKDLLAKYRSLLQSPN